MPLRAPLSWLREYIDIDVPVEELARKLTLAGLEVEHIETVGEEWENIYTGQVAKLEQQRCRRLEQSARQHRVQVGSIGGADHPADHHDLAVVCQRVEAREQDSRRDGNGWGQGVDRHGMLRAVGVASGGPTASGAGPRSSATTPRGHGTKSPSRRVARQNLEPGQRLVPTLPNVMLTLGRHRGVSPLMRA